MIGLKITNMENDQQLKEILSAHLDMGKAFMPVDKIVTKVPFEKTGIRPDRLPYSFYELFYHIQFAQKDILEYCRNKDYAAPDWPEDYWPPQSSPPNERAWEDLQQEYFETRSRLKEFVEARDHRLSEPISEHSDHTRLREVLLVIEHSAYHTGQLLVLARLLEEHSR